MMLQKIVKFLIYHRYFPFAGVNIIRIISATYKIAIINNHIENRILKKGQVPVYASWHQRFFAGIAFVSTRRPLSIMISRSRDGEFISKIIKILGHNPVRGSSSRGGSEALHEIRRLAEKGNKIGHIVDGPTGPFGVVKPGLINIAQRTGMPILPTIVSPENKWTFNSWDRFMVPRPFSRIIIRFGDELYIPARLKRSEFEEKQVMVERILKKLYSETDSLWGNPDKIDQLFYNQ